MGLGVSVYNSMVIVKGLMLNRKISLLHKILAVISDQLDPVEYFYCRKHRIHYERPTILWYGEPVFVMCPKCFEEKFGENLDFMEVVL